MTKLESALKEIGADCLQMTPQQTSQWLVFCEQYDNLFTQVCDKKPDVVFTHHLLGLLTKAHIESQATVESHKQAIQTMQETFAQHLSPEQASKFENQSLLKLELVTHLWLYLQGYLKMDFSLANDHAEQTALTITDITSQDSQILRTHFLQSYYAGEERSPIKRSASPLFSWLKSLFNRSNSSS
tara:strand:+ start:2070 stop:2624 length:555 start_codon:yes stop_codon:yes gene_type:complete